MDRCLAKSVFKFSYSEILSYHGERGATNIIVGNIIFWGIWCEGAAWGSAFKGIIEANAWRVIQVEVC
jgi:hypothetical protein